MDVDNGLSMGRSPLSGFILSEIDGILILLIIKLCHYVSFVPGKVLLDCSEAWVVIFIKLVLLKLEVSARYRGLGCEDLI